MQVVAPSVPTQGVDTLIHGVYDDTQIVPLGTMPAGSILIRFIQSKYLTGAWPPILASNWTEDLPNIAASEAAMRVEVCYTAAQQRAASLLVQNDMMQYGTDPTAWPPSEQARYAETQRGLAYINAMNAAQQTIVNQTILNPCDDQYWPAPIDPIQL